MDSTLVTVTVLSMTMAAALSAIVWRMLRLERQRSNARVASLAAVALRPDRPPRVVEDPVLVPQAAGVGPALDPDGMSAARMFVARERESPWRARFLVMTALALVIASAVLFSLAARAPKARVARGATANVTQAAGTPSGAELELMALHDSRQTGSLTITGLVQNPRTGTQLSRVAVTAYTFDDKGSFLASGRAPLDVTALAPGDESPFTVTVPVTDDVARYRIGFRDETGRVIAHIDRRQPSPVASNSQ
jgi:hypothetical protein